MFSSFAMVIPPVDPASCPHGFNLNAKQFEEELGVELATDCGDPGAHPDPETGVCTSLSTVWEVETVPAFIVHPGGQVAAR